MTKSCIALRHVQFEGLGSYERVFEKAGYEITYLDVALSENLNAVLEADLGVFLGGPIGVYEGRDYPYMDREIELAHQRLLAQKPTFGICLGAQIMATALGAKVYPGQAGKEIGWHPLTLNEAGQNSFLAPLGEGNGQMLHWHGDTFDLPNGATLLASSQKYPHQVFSIDHYALAFQCHPELDPDMIEYWLIGHACEIANTPDVDPVTLRRETERYGKDLAERGARALSAWLKGLA